MRGPVLLALGLFAFALGAPAAVPLPAHAAEAVPTPRLLLPVPDADRGRQIFVDKACIVCHAVGGVGGQAAPSLDAVSVEGPLTVDVMDFVARMWAGAYAMSELQAIELGYQITLTGQDIADLAAFATLPAAQKDFTINEVPEPMRGWFLDQPYWENEGWADRFEAGDWAAPGGAR